MSHGGGLPSHGFLKSQWGLRAPDRNLEVRRVELRALTKFLLDLERWSGRENAGLIGFGVSQKWVLVWGLPPGSSVTVTCIEAFRASLSSPTKQMFCVLMVIVVPWVCARSEWNSCYCQNGNVTYCRVLLGFPLWTVLDVKMQQLGPGGACPLAVR